MLKEVYKSIMVEREAVRDIFSLVSDAFCAIDGIMKALDINTINLDGLEYDRDKMCYRFKGVNVEAVEIDRIKPEQADTVFEFAKAFPSILQKLTDQLKEDHNKLLEKDIEVLKNRLVESAL